MTFILDTRRKLDVDIRHKKFISLYRVGVARQVTDNPDQS